MSTALLTATAAGALVGLIAVGAAAAWRRDRRMRDRGRAAFLAVVEDDLQVTALEEQRRRPARDHEEHGGMSRP